MAADSDMQTHRAMYERVVGMLKYGGIAVVILAFLILYVISYK